MQDWNNTIMFGVLSAAVIVLTHVVLRRRMQVWGRAVLFGALSAAVIVFIYATPPYRDSHFAGANFGYNFSFFFPALFSSFIFWAAALGFYVAFLRHRAGRSPATVILPVFLLLPFALQVAYMVVLVVIVESSV
jgi:hypothetical protein